MPDCTADYTNSEWELWKSWFEVDHLFICFSWMYCESLTDIYSFIVAETLVSTESNI